MLKGFLGLLLICYACLSGAVFAQAGPAPATRAAGEKRVALVIGNAAYKSGPLDNPVNDAQAMAASLRQLGFDVILRENLKTRDIGGVYREFRSKIVPGGAALVFYAGHGVQFKGENYFPAVDTEIHGEEDVPLQSINLNTLLGNMEEAKAGVNLVFLDACRDNPFARRFRSSTRGLAKVEAASGTLIHYATRPGSVAADGEGRNGTYTEALLAQINQPGVPVEMMLKRVANHVVQKTGGKQEPWVEGHLRGEFYFIFKGPTTVNVLPGPGGVDPAAVELSFWDSIKSSQDKADFEEYLRKYPNGQFAGIARNRLRQLSPVTPPVATAPAAVAPAPSLAAGKVFKDCADCPEMVIVPAGSFEMGSTNGDSDEKSVHTVWIGKPYAIGRTEVTQRQWRVVMGRDPFELRFKGCDDCPVESVSWRDTQEFVRKLSLKTGKNYRLPSEAEWEYSCRAGSRHTYCGSDIVNSVAWSGLNSGARTHPVAGKEANAWGLYDMSGNVMELVEDCWHDSYNGAPTDGGARTGESCAYRRTVRGGGWGDKPEWVRAAHRIDFMGRRTFTLVFV